MEQITINLLATGVTPVCHVSQFDDGRTIRINLKKGADIFTLSGTEEVKMRIRKPDNTERVVNITNTASSYVDYVSTPEDCDIEGVNVCELVIDNLGSKNFLMNVEEDAYGGGADVETLTASGPVASFETNMVDNLVDLKAEITPIQDLHGYDYPWPAGGGKNILLKPFVHYSLAPDNLADMFFIKAGDYRFSFSDSTAENWRVGMRMKDAEGNDLTDIAYKPNSGMSWRSTINCWLGGTDSTTKNISITIVEDCYIRMIFGLASTSADTEFSNVQLEKGTTQTNYEPVENICPITGHAEAKIVHAGKNLIKNIVAQGQSANHVLLGQSNSNTHETYLKRGVYTISYKTAASNIPSLYLKRIGVSQNVKLNNADTKATFIIEDDDFYRFWVYSGGGANASDVSEPQIELGSAATDYEPFAGAEVTVQFGQTIYKGLLDAKNNKVILTFVLVDLGSLTWGHSISGTRNFFYTTRAFEVAPKGVTQGRTNDDKSSEYRCAQYSEVVNGTVLSSFNIPNTTKRIYLYDASKTNMTAEEFTAAVAGVQLLYEIETPIEIPLSAISQFETLLGINNVYADIGDVELKYLKQV